MFTLDNISLVQFRNYEQADFTFTGQVTGFCGKNGSGKTNLLDAIYYMCFTKSYFAKTDAQNTQQHKSGFRLDAKVTLQNKNHHISSILRESGKKEFSVDHENYTRFAAHIGKFPCVMVAPDDIAIITSASEERRKFIDYTISQLDAVYLQTLIDYNKLLQHRNSLLKQFSESGVIDESLMEVVSVQLVTAGNCIYARRRSFLETFIPTIIGLYDSISEHKEKLSINYRSNLESVDFKLLLENSRMRDIALQRTTQGVHRDDIEFYLKEYPFKSTASQGQRKSLLFALKLAEFQVLLQHKGFPPLLLLDDVFEKLDETRMKNLLLKVCIENNGQVFITDTHCNRLKQALDDIKVSYQIVEL